MLLSLEIPIKPWKEAKIDAFAVRQAVFIHEQGVPAELEIDELDPLAMHALAYQDSACVGTGRLVNLGNGQFQIGRMAVLEDLRGQGVGQQILKILISLAIQHGAQSILLHSQVSALSFYEKLGFQAEGPTYDEAGIPHRNMMLFLP